MWKVAVFVALISVCFGVDDIVLKAAQRNTTFPRDVENKRGLGIIGGRNTTINKHPYQVVVYTSKLFCSGAILSKYYVLTLADCVYGQSAGYFKVRVGSNYSDMGGNVYTAQSIVISPKYNSDNQSYDLGLIKLSRPLMYSSTVQNIKLGTTNLSGGEKAVISGWGYDRNGYPFKEANVSVIDFKTCNNTLSSYGYSIDSSMFCAGATDAFPYYGDFGDPIVVRNKLYGLFAWALKGKLLDSVYASVPAAANWIQKVIGS